MWWFHKKKSIKDSGLLDGFTDFHSHILPEVDDGIPTMKEALEVLAWYEEMGIKKVVLTPHIMEEYPKNNRQYLLRQLEMLKQQYKGKVEMTLGAEYMLDASFDTHLLGGKLLTIESNHVLVETSCVNKPIKFEQLINELHTKGYHIILAHPERYTYMENKEYKILKEKHIFFQMNLLSLTGCYGEQVRLKAKMLLSKRYYEYIGTDIHNLKFHQNQLHHKNPKLNENEMKQIKQLIRS
ncbi:MAG: CpsB/CapC family capsule biosynthesis tyrosine phosphatase [Bacteroides sp.]|uniref:tyrosine-protein phosphatase n=1 Tax=Bacteroides sp. TaxID=29523 RepID=UPI002FC62916